MPQVFQKGCKIKIIEYGQSCDFVCSLVRFKENLIKKIKNLF